MAALRAVLLALPAVVLAQPMAPCTWSSPNYSASFDVTALYAYPAQGSYIWSDPNDYETTNSSYIFNVCSNTVVPQQWNEICAEWGRGPAFQITNNGGGPLCYPLGKDLSTTVKNKITWSLIDPTDPSVGVALTYLSPQSDAACPGNSARSFTIDFGCAKAPFPLPGQTPSNPSLAFIDEKDVCNYRAHSWSIAGCPLECPVVGGALCGGNGVCGYDKGQNAPRCFCYDDWTEKDCQTPSSAYPSSAVAGAVIGGLLFGALSTVGAAWFLAYYRSRKAGAAAADAPVDGFYAPVNA